MLTAVSLVHTFARKNSTLSSDEDGAPGSAVPRSITEIDAVVWSQPNTACSSWKKAKASRSSARDRSAGRPSVVADAELANVSTTLKQIARVQTLTMTPPSLQVCWLLVLLVT